MKEYIFVDNYGEMLAQVHGMELVSFEEDGGYQGKYLAVLKDKASLSDWDLSLPERLYYFIDSYGSCSGCDWLEDRGNEFSYEAEGETYKEREKLKKQYAVKYIEAIEYCQEIKPKFITPAERPLKFINKGEYDGFELVND
jgi:hypothetical protein